MGKTKTKLTYLIELALLVGILLMMNITGLAMIPLPGHAIALTSLARVTVVSILPFSSR